MDQLEDLDRHLAGRFDMGVAGFRRLFGVGWSRATVIDDLRSDDWYVAGKPVQLMLGFPMGTPVLARPVGTWEHLGELSYQPMDVTNVDETRPERIEQVRADMLRRRRSSFRYCPHCLRVTEPEYRTEGACMGCASAVGDVVF